MNALKRLIVEKRQFLLYGVIGLSGLGLHSLVYALLTRLAHIDYQLANALGYSCGTVLSFVLNWKVNFRVSDRILARLASFVVVALLGLGMQTLVLDLMVKKNGINQDVSFVFSLVLVVLLQYNLNRLVSFRKAS